MLSYCSRCRKNSENKNSDVPKINNEKTMMFSRFAVCGNIKSKFIKEQEASGLLSLLGTRAPSSKIPLLADNLF